MRVIVMGREINQRELRNDSGSIMREVEAGNSFTVTRNGEPIAELVPLRRRRFIRRSAAIEQFIHGPSISFEDLRADLDDLVDQSIEPRA